VTGDAVDGGCVCLVGGEFVILWRMDALLNICSAFGLSGAAGLNAYIPLLTIAIMQNRHVINLAKPYDVMGEWWVIAILVVLLVVEIVADKIPGVDHVNDIIHTAVRPTAGALIFASQMGHVTWVHPGVWVVIGILMSGSVHTGKAVSRPVVNMGTAGIGAPVVSVIEDLVSTTLSIVAILAPIVGVLLLFLFGWILYKLFRKFFGGWSKEKRVYQVRAYPVQPNAAPAAALPGPIQVAEVTVVDAPQPAMSGSATAREPGASNREWGGGV
jgi:hypothetical protein